MGIASDKCLFMPKLYDHHCRPLCHIAIFVSKACFLMIFILAQFSSAYAVVRYVKPGSAGTAPYTTWATASNDLQAVINACIAGDEIWIAAGTYKPNRRADALTVITVTDRNNAFVLKSGVRVYGGFTGTETLLSQRNATTNIVTLSGDIGTVGVNTDNCYHVVISAGLSAASTILDGVSIAAGNANASVVVPSVTVNAYSISPRNGGGLYKVASNTDINACTFRRNDAVNAGGGIYETLSAVTSVYSNCTITQNASAGSGGGMYIFSSSCLYQNSSFTDNTATGTGAGIYWSGSGSPAFTNCSINSNDAVGEGGGIYFSTGAGSPSFRECTIQSNTSGGNGGGISNYCGGTLSLLSTIISGNTAAVTGGGIYNNNSPAAITNCLITGNLANGGAGIWNSFSDAVIINCTIAGNRSTAQGGGMSNGSSNPVIQNTIIYGNTAVPAASRAIYNSGSTPVVEYCLVEGGYAGPANVSGNPLFISPVSAALAPTTTGNYQVQKCSPAINGGRNAYIPALVTTDIINAPRVHYGTVDLGSYELPLQLAVPSPAGILYVDSSKNGDGSSWVNAAKELSDALVAAKYDNSIQQIWVAKGTYYPKYNAGDSSSLACTNSNRKNSFVLVDGVKMYGGFAGGESDTSNINPALNKTILSGDIGTQLVSTDNVYHVAISSNIGLGHMVGFHITGGKANTLSGADDVNTLFIISKNGAGLYARDCDLYLRACSFLGNASESGGSGLIHDRTNDYSVVIMDCSWNNNIITSDFFSDDAMGAAILFRTNFGSARLNARIENTSFKENSGISLARNIRGGAISAGGGFQEIALNNCSFLSNKATLFGGSIFMIGSPGQSTLELMNTSFEGDSARLGGALHLYEVDGLIDNCHFFSNKADRGGAVFTDECSLSFKRTVFAGNLALAGGGAAIEFNLDDSQITNCLFSGNKANLTGTVSLFSSTTKFIGCTFSGNKQATGNNGVALVSTSGTYLPEIHNSIFWNNEGQTGIGTPILTDGVVSYSNVQGGFTGTGNITVDPLFVNPQPPSAAPTTAGDYRLQKCSPAVNSGSNGLVPPGITLDLDSSRRIAYGTVDMGSYEKHLARPDTNGIVYVDSSNIGMAGNGSSWANAVTELADAMKEARDNSDIKEIWVAKGTYKPLFNAADAFKNTLCNTPSRDDAFVLSKDVKIYGGFANGETILSARNISLNRTILDGDLGVVNDTADNSYHVLIGAGNLGSAVLDGFSITNGNATASFLLPSILVNTISVSRFTGGGLTILNSSPELKYCTFYRNTGLSGGAIFHNLGGKATITESAFYENSAISNGNGGGAIYTLDSIQINKCKFRANEAGLAGGGVFANFGSGSHATILNSIFTGNKADIGGAIALNFNAGSTIMNCTIGGNNALSEGGGIYTGGNSIGNCIIWNNKAGTSYDGIYGNTNSVTYSIVQDGHAGVGNVNEDPLFVSPQLPALAPTSSGDYHIQACSPAINLGDNSLLPSGITKDLDSLDRIRYTTVDMGAYEMQDIDLASTTWKGVNSNWNDKINWCGGYVPYDTTNVNIPLTPNQPAIGTGYTNAVKNISLGNGTSLSVAPTSSFTINGTYSNAGSSISNLGEWVMAGNEAAQSFPGALGNITDMHTLRIKNPSGISLNKSFSISGALIPEAGNIELNNDTVTLQSRSTATARIDSVRSGASFSYTGTGKFDIERFIPAKKAWRLLTAPVNAYQPINADWQEGQTNLSLVNSNTRPGYGTHISGPQNSSGFDYTNTNNPSMLMYNQPGNTMAPIPNTNVLNLNHQQGYMLFVHGSRAYDLTLNHLGTPDSTILRSRGTIKTGDQDVAIAASGFTLVGNPYASAVDFDQLQKTNVGNAFTLWDPSRTGSYGYGGYVTFTKVGPVYVAAPAPVSAGIGQYIQSGAAFFVEGSGSAGNIRFHEKSKTDNNVSTVFRSGDSAIASLRINLSRVSASTGQHIPVDGTLAVFTDWAQEASDPVDAAKKMNDNQNIGLMRGGKILSIEGRPVIQVQDTLYLSSTQLQQREYILEIIPSLLYRAGLQAWLIDNYLNQHIPLSLSDTGRYQFTVQPDAASAAANRFRIVFQQDMAGPVPVRFTGIHTICSNGAVKLSWTVAEEEQIESYGIEASADGRNFESIGQVTVDSLSGSSVKTYQFIHTGAAEGMSFYRVLANDVSGEKKYSNVVVADKCHLPGSISVYPNPVEESVIHLHFRQKPAGLYQVQLIDLAGKKVFSQSLTHTGGSNRYQLNPGQLLAAGKYMLTVFDTGQQQVTIPLMIQ